MKVPLLVLELATKGMRLMVMMRRLEVQREMRLAMRIELVPEPGPEKGVDLLM